MPDPSPPSDLPDLAAVSARIGADPLLIQAAGGNTSVKDGAAMWIKASGTLLADAQARDIFVPVDLAAMRAAIAAGEDRADRPAEFALGDSGLRPSIETCLHALFRHRVVIHVHCVNTIALAIRQDARAQVAARLDGVAWALAPYAKPGALLAAQVLARMRPDTDMVVLGNHGLLVAGDSVAEAEARLDAVVRALHIAPAAGRAPDMAALAAFGGWTVPEAVHPLHQVALDADRLAQATRGSLYPDHVIFCGPAARASAAPAPASPDDPPFVLVPGKGALLHPAASAGAQALARCLGDVMLRVPADAPLTYLTPADDAALLDWDAEKYRQAMNAR